MSLNQFALPHAPSLSLKPLFSIVLSAAAVTFGLFFAMQKLIENKAIPQVKGAEPPVIVITYDFEESPTIERPPIAPPPEPIPQPKPEPLKIEPTDPNDWTPPLVNTLVSVPNIGPAIVNNNANQTRSASPIVRIEPKYPLNAAREGIQGWVALSFDITASGEVDNIDIVDSEPRRIFDRAAKRALSKWKYRPNLEAGEATRQQGIQVRLDFKLDS